MTTECSYQREGALFAGTAAIIMGTKLEVLLCGVEENEAKGLWERIIEELVSLDKLFNRFRADSDVSAWNEGGIPTEALIKAIGICDGYKERTGGVFDVGLSGKLDFGGFAKGYALREINGMLRRGGITGAFVNFGNSSIVTIGSHPLGGDWKVDLPNPWTGQTVGQFCLRGKALSVSGNSPQYVGHIINPQTGAADMSHRLSSVVCDDPLDAEVLSTAALASSPEQLEHLKSAFPDAEISIIQ